VYDGEEGKRADFVHSLAPALYRDVLLPWLQERQGCAIVLAEEWQTTDAVPHLDWLLRRAGVRDRVAILWNANNTFGFHRITGRAWRRPPRSRPSAATCDTGCGRSAWIHSCCRIGLSREAFEPPDREAVASFRARTRGRLVVTKVARRDPDKRWPLAIDTVGALERAGYRPLLVARVASRHTAARFWRGRLLRDCGWSTGP
jgi:hypothetical protein